MNSYKRIHMVDGSHHDVLTQIDKPAPHRFERASAFDFSPPVPDHVNLESDQMGGWRWSDGIERREVKP